MVSYVSSRPYYVQSLKTTIKDVSQIKLVGKFLYVLDRDETNSKVHVYRMNIGGQSAPNKQAMEIVGYIDHAPFAADKFDVMSFDVAVFPTVQKVFMADKSFGLRTIDLNTEKSVLNNAFSNQMSHSLIGVAVHTCEEANSCFLVTSLDDSSLAYASWGRNGNYSALNFISPFALPKAVSITEKLTVSENYLTVLSQSGEGNRLHVFNIPTGKFVKSISAIGAIDYRPVSESQNDFFVDCNGQVDGSCKVFVPNPINHLEEYIIRPHFSVKVQSASFKSSYFNVYTRTNTEAQTVTINKPGQPQHVQKVEETQQVSEEVVIPVTNPFGIPMRPSALPAYAMSMKMQELYGGRVNNGAKGVQGGMKDSGSGSDDSTSTTTFHTWFIIFLIILGGLAILAHYTNKTEKPPVVVNPIVHDAPSVLDSEPLIRPNFIESQAEPTNDIHYRMLQEEREEENPVRVDTGLENDQNQVEVQVGDDEN